MYQIKLVLAAIMFVVFILVMGAISIALLT